MLRWLRRRGFSGEKRSETVTDISGRIDDRELDRTIHKGKDPRLSRTLREQNEEGTSGYFDALQKQRRKHIGADGSPVRLGSVDRETGQIGEPFIRKEEESRHNPGPPPLPPTSAA